MIRVLDRKADWFPVHQRSGYRASDQAPQPRFALIRRDRDGLLWAIHHVADRNWRDGVEFRGNLQSRALYQPRSPREYYDGLIEIIDVQKQQVIVQQRFDQPFHGYTQSGLLITYRLEEEYPFIDLWRARLVGFDFNNPLREPTVYLPGSAVRSARGSRRGATRRMALVWRRIAKR